MSSPTNPSTDLVALHAAILSDLATLFPPTPQTSPPGPAWTLAFYGRVDTKIPTPSIYLELTDIAAGEGNGGDIGTDQWAVTLRFEAYVFTDYKAPNYRILTRLNAARLAAYLVGHQWTGVAGGPCRALGAHLDRFTPDANAGQYDCMRVEFEMDCLIGLDSWAGGTTPTKVFVGFQPNTGTAHEADYVEVV